MMAALPPITSRLTISGDQFQLGGSTFRIFGTGGVETCCAFDDADERAGMPARVAARGYNFMRLTGFNNKVFPDGCWTDTSYTAFNETYMVRLDETIANLNARGIYVWLTFDHYDRAAAGAGLSAATTKFYGMMWDTTDYVPMWKAHIEAFLNRTNTVTGVAYKNNPGIAVWQCDNENGMSDSFRANRFDAIVNGALSPWQGRLDTLINAWWNTNYGSNAPGSAFPTKATYNGWSQTDRQRMWEFLADQEIAYAADMHAWLKSYNAGILTCICEFNYMDPRASYEGDICSRHNYAPVASGDSFAPPYTTRTTILADTNGLGSWSSGCHDTSHPYVVTERGQYGLNRYDYEVLIIEAVVHGLQGWSGFCTGAEGQNKWQNLIVGVQSSHLLPCWHSRQLASLLAAPIMRYGFIAPLSLTRTYDIAPGDISTKAESRGNSDLSGWQWTSAAGGNEWAFLQRKAYTNYNAGTTSVADDAAYNDATIAGGVAVTSEVYWKSDGIKLTASKVDGWCGAVANGTAGTLTISGVTPYVGVCMVRSNGDYALYAGPALFFALRHTTVYISTDGDIGFTGTADGETVTSWGTESNTRLVMPAAFQVALTTPSAKKVYGVTKRGELIDMAASYSGGTTRFTTDQRCPLYYIP